VADKAADIRRHAAAFAWKSDAMNRFSFFVFLAGSTPSAPARC